MLYVTMARCLILDRNLHTDFVCWRGLLTKLLCTPFENRDGWRIAVTLFKGTLYMCEFDTESRKRQKQEMSERQKEMTYWGWKFEQYVTAGNTLISVEMGLCLIFGLSQCPTEKKSHLNRD